MVGGGNYIEYQNLVDYCKVRLRLHTFLPFNDDLIFFSIHVIQNKSKSAPKRILYGTTDLMNANQFLQQLSKLGEEIN